MVCKVRSVALNVVLTHKRTKDKDGKLKTLTEKNLDKEGKLNRRDKDGKLQTRRR